MTASRHRRLARTPTSGSGSGSEVWTLKGVDPTVAVAARLGGELQLLVAQDEDDVCGVKYTLCG